MERRVSIESLGVTGDMAHANVVVFEEQTIEGQKVENAIGEAQISFKEDEKKEDILLKVKEAGKMIEEASAKAKALREELNGLIKKGGLK